jgi:UDP-N-acetylglucosamine--N-acetylmuramyl-(pentapeptide) pyrophosphoryl-undecaprenol N-acetylglucosamine transferase
LVESCGIPFQAISSGKLRRYWSLENVSDILRIALGTVQALAWFVHHPTDVVISAGGYVGVPVGVAAWLWRVPVCIHQQDVRASLTNKILAPLASRITVAFSASLTDFPRQKTVVTGNPVRRVFYHGSRSDARAKLNLPAGVPVVAVLGGGTGAEALNRVVREALPQLTTAAHVLHLTGRGREASAAANNTRYHQIDFTTDTVSVLAAADVVVTRAGMGTLGELGALGRAAVVVPMPSSHQEDNARLLHERGAAAVMPQVGLTAQALVATVTELLSSEPKRELLADNIKKLFPSSAAANVAREVQSAVGRT